MKILILKPSSLGDVIHAIPVLRMLKLRHPEAECHWWIGSELAPLLEKDPDLSGVFLFDRREASNPFFWPELFRHITAMRALRFDYVIDLQSLARSGIVAWFANGTTTIGLSDPREGATAFYDLTMARPSWHTHAVDWYLRVLEPLNTPVNWNFTWLPRREDIQRRVAERFPRTGPRVVLVPGARWENKRWPVEFFARLARLLLEIRPGLQVTVLGGKSDLAAGQTIKQAAPAGVQDLAGRTTLPEMVEVLRESELVITNDTGPMHIAAALGIPLLPLFGPTEPARTGPYGQTDRVLRHPVGCVPCMLSRCHNHQEPLACLRGVSPEMVRAEAASLLAAVNNGGRGGVDKPVA